MSCNITCWKTNKIENLVIPIKAFYPDVMREDWRLDEPEIDPKTGEITIWIGEGFVKGKPFPVLMNNETPGLVSLKTKAIVVDEIYIEGEGSGTYFTEFVQYILQNSRGRLNARLVWEGGESIELLTVENGILKTIEI